MNSFTSPNQTTTKLSPSAFRRRRGIPAAVRQQQIWPVAARKPSSTATPRATMRDLGAVGELPETKGSFYELLGIPASGSFDVIKRAYKQMARKYHPDVSPTDRTAEYTRRFIEVKEAYETLSDPSHRAIYDHRLLLTVAGGKDSGEEMEKKSWWKNHSEDQLEELNRRSMMKNSDGNLSWGARMRRRRSADATPYY